MRRPTATYPLRTGDIFPLSSPMPHHQLIGRVRWVRSVATAVANGTNVAVPGGRKVGKTSACGGVVAMARETHGMLTIEVDLYEMEDVEGFLDELANATITTVAPATQKLRASGRRVVGKILGAAADEFGVGPEFEKLASTLPASGDRLEAILGLPDHVGQVYRKPVLLFIDEVQRIGDVPEGFKRTVHRVLRDSERVTLLFAGTNDGLMRDLEESPLGPVSDLVAHRRELESIEDVDWQLGLPRLFHWGGCSIDDEAVEFIIEEGKRIGVSPVHSTVVISHHTHLQAVIDGASHIDKGAAMHGLVNAGPDLERIGRAL